MSVDTFKFNPEDGLLNSTAFPTQPPNETEARRQVQSIVAQLSDYVNQKILNGTGNILADDAALGSLLQSGWMSLPACTYVSATSFTIAQDIYSVITPGDKIRLVQSGATKYFYVVGVSVVGNTTTVNVSGGSDYALANSAITSPCFSHAASPDRFPDWLNWVPTLGASGSMTVAVLAFEQAKFKMNGREVVISMHVSFSLGGTASNTVTVTLPISSSYAYACVSASVLDTTAFGGGVAIIPATTNSTLSVRKPDASNFSIGDAKQISLGGSYVI